MRISETMLGRFKSRRGFQQKYLSKLPHSRITWLQNRTPQCNQGTLGERQVWLSIWQMQIALNPTPHPCIGRSRNIGNAGEPEGEAMKQKTPLFRFLDMPVSVHPSALIGSLILAIILMGAGMTLSGLSAQDAVLAASVALGLHWFAVLVHNYGHFFVAKRIGYPSTGLLLRLIFARVNYPDDEGELTPKIHLKRALSGPLFSLILALLAVPIALVWLIPGDGIAQFLGYWLLLDYGWVFTFGALFPPMRFEWFTNDGGTIWNILGETRGRSQRAS
jgi:hypothetical protein